MMPERVWTCPACQSEQTHETVCETCHAARFATWAIMVGHHVLEHLEDGESDPLRVLELMQARPAYRNSRLTLNFIGQQIRLLTKDTRPAARRIFDANAARMALNVVHNGDTKDQIAVLKGRQVLGDVVEHKGEVVTRFVVETNPGPPPKESA